MGFYLTEQMTETPAKSTPFNRHPRLGAKKGHGAPFLHTILSTKYWDADTKTLAYQLRDYSPGMGRWLSQDPIGENGGENVYAFVRNALTFRIDLLGLLIKGNPIPTPIMPPPDDWPVGQQCRCSNDCVVQATLEHDSISYFDDNGLISFTVTVRHRITKKTGDCPYIKYLWWNCIKDKKGGIPTREGGATDTTTAYKDVPGHWALFVKAAIRYLACEKGKWIEKPDITNSGGYSFNFGERKAYWIGKQVYP